MIPDDNTPTPKLGSGSAGVAWVPRALVLLSPALIVLAIGFAVASMMSRDSVTRSVFGQVSAVSAIAGFGGLCVGLGCLLFGWTGGSPRVPVGSHRSIVSTIVLSFVIAVLLSVGYVQLFRSNPADEAGVLVAFSIAFYGSLLALVYLQAVRTGALDRARLGLSADGLPRAVGVGLLAAAALISLAAANGFVLHALGIEQPQQEALHRLRGSPPLQYGIVVSILVFFAPMVEELFFRGYVFNAYLRTKGVTTAYVATSALFALVHGLPSLFLGLFGMGLILAYSYRRSGSIVASMLAHVLNNGVGVALLIVSSTS